MICTCITYTVVQILNGSVIVQGCKFLSLKFQLLIFLTLQLGFSVYCIMLYLQDISSNRKKMEIPRLKMDVSFELRTPNFEVGNFKINKKVGKFKTLSWKFQSICNKEK